MEYSGYMRYWLMRKTVLLALLIAGQVLGASVSAQDRLPKVTLKDLNGKAVMADTLSNSGRPFIVDFFATWCKPCNRELDAISDVYEDWRKETGVRLIAVSIDEAQNSSKVKPFVESNGWQYDVLLDANGDLMRAMGFQSIPYVIIVDGDGNIAYRHSGYTDGAEEELIETVRRLSKKK